MPVPLLDALAAARTSRGASAARDVVVLDEFLSRSELDALVDWVVAREPQFRGSRVLDPDGRAGHDAHDHRRSVVLYDAGPSGPVIRERLLGVLGHVQALLGGPPVSEPHIELQITASNDGEYFRPHTDNSHTVLSGRELTFVHFFHREPARFAGGRLRLWGPEGYAGPPRAEIVPRQNQAVFFRPHLFHEIETVRCPSGAFVDSRFTVNGWYRTDTPTA